MHQTEDAVNQLQHLTGLADSLAEPPAILEADFGDGGAPCPLNDDRDAGVSSARRSDDATAKRDELPAWYPSWAQPIADLYFSRTTSVFVLHGNTYDLVPLVDVDAPRRAEFGTIPDFLAEQLFGRWDLVLHYDLGRGLRVFAGRNEKRLKDMVALGDAAHWRSVDGEERSGRRVHAAGSVRPREHHVGRRRSSSASR